MASEAYKFTSADAENYEHYLGPVLFEPFAKIVASQIKLLSVHNVLELAAGSGRVTRHIRESIGQDAALLATDISADMLAIAQRNLTGKNIQFKTEDILNLSFPDNSFDLVVCQFGMMFLSDKQKGFNEIHRVLKTDGKLLCFTWDSSKNQGLMDLLINQLMLPFFAGEDATRLSVPFSLHDKDQLQKWMGNAGFQSVSTTTFAAESGAVSVDHLVEGLFFKHALGKAMLEKGEEAASKVATAFRSNLEKLSKDGLASLAMSAVLTCGTK